jgi:hypothetical protein
MKYQKLLITGMALATAATIACNKTSPTAPDTDPFGAGANPDGSTLKVTAPAAVSPAANEEVSTAPQLIVDNSAMKFAGNVTLEYIFEVVDSGNRVVYRSNPVAQGPNGRTEHEISSELTPDVTFSWRAYAVYQGQRGPMSPNRSFRTTNRFGVSCASVGNPIGIVACRFEQHGGTSMDPEELVQFMREVAFDLNRANLSDKGGFGLAIKTVGNNCLGYSCDILCEGHGNDQNQYDILIDETIPNWLEVEEVTVRECEIIR